MARHTLTTSPEASSPLANNKEGATAMSKRVVLEFPVELPKESLRNKEVIKKAKEMIVLELLRRGEISQGRATELLEISRHDLFDLMARYDIPTANFSLEELQRQREELAKSECATSGAEKEP